MKRNLRVFREKWQVPVHLCCGFMPAALLLGAYGLPDRPYTACAVAGVYVLFALMSLLLSGKARLAAGAAGLIAVIGSGVWLFTRDPSPSLLLPPILYGWLLIETLPLYGKDSREEMPPHIFVLSVVLHLAGAFAQFICRRNGVESFEQVVPGLALSFIVFFVLTLLNLNRVNIIYTAALEKTVPRHIYRYNRALALGLAALTLLLGTLPAIVNLIRRLWNTVVGLIARFFAWFHSLFPVTEVTPSGAEETGERMVLSAESEPGLLAAILDVLLKVMMAALALLALWFILRYLRKIIRRLWQRLLEYTAAANEDYVDEITDTREDGERRRGLRKVRKKHDPLKGINVRKLAPGARIRYYYTKLLYGHKDWTAGSTARENLPEQAAALYERARYSTHEVTAADADAFFENTRSL